MISECMLCGKPLDTKKDKGRYFMNIDVIRVKEAPSPFVRSVVKSRERAMVALWMCGDCGRSIVDWVERRRIDVY